MSNARFSIVPAWIITDTRLKGSDLKVLCLLGSYTNKEGWCRRSQVKMADELGCSRSSVQASLNRLYQMGVVEKRQVDSQDGRDSAHYYRVIHDRAVSDTIMAAWHEAGDDEENVPISGAESAQTPATLSAPPATIVAPPATSEQAPPATPGAAPINDTSLTTPLNERERGRARTIESEKEDMRSLQRRYRTLEIGEHGNPWPGVLSSGGDWGFRQFLSLTPEERQRAEERRDAYLAACPKIKSGERKGQPDAPALGVYLRDKRFDLVTHVAPQLVSKGVQPVDVPVAPLGPIWGALRMLSLLDGARPVEMPLDLHDRIRHTFEALRKSNESRAMAYLSRKGIRLSGDGALVFPDDFDEAEWRRMVRDEGFPEVNRLDQQARARERGKTDAKHGVLAALCEAVEVGKALFEEWCSYHDMMGWPSLPDPKPHPVIWLPKGGPAGLAAFEIAARAALTTTGNEDRGDEHAA